MKSREFRLGLAALLVPCCFFISRAHGVQDDFNDGNDNGWTRYEPLAPFGGGGTYSFPAGVYRIQVAPSSNPATLGLGRAGAFRADAAFTDFQVSVDVDNLYSTAVDVAARMSDLGLGTTDGYTFRYGQYGILLGLWILRFDNEASQVLGGNIIGLDPSNAYRFVFSGIGDKLIGQAFDLRDLSTPLVTTFATDATYSNGVSGLLVTTEGAAGYATFDNFVVQVPEPSSGFGLLFGAILAWCNRRRR